ncbi:alpha- and gamma-adaptin-binding protein p34-like [Belonocnema kinseyi]|uniref:alpha- and gamma-adaptin-binding protein p34-like n=1 Tax=Belonocnema kinseyi TaxID=2817044 RepID=UPI00143D74D6|nr:alpha- and gamma-adaptin-binding protein p34-like [Belonocnema kinseyi]
MDPLIFEKDLPRALIFSNASGKAGEIAKNMGAESISEQGGLEYYLWNIDNKYYTAQVLLCATQNLPSNISYEGVEALIVHHEPQSDHALQNLDTWKSLIPSLSDVEVLLLVCNSINDPTVKEQVVEWCMTQKFELVELEKSNLQEDDEFEAERNSFGIDRIIEALQAHTWSKMKLKDQSSTREPIEEISRVGEQIENIQIDAQSNLSERLQMENVFDGIMDSENVDFGELFGQLMAMKEHAASLPTNQRKVAAEQLVTAFWKAMGGDPSEISDLD